MVKVESLSDLELINNIKLNSCNDSFLELSERHSRLFYKICHRYLKILESYRYSKEELFENKDFIIFDAAIKFDINRKAKFSTWLGIWTRFFCLNKINKLKNMPVVNSEEEIANSFNDESIEKFSKTTKERINLNNVKKVLSKLGDSRITSVFKLRYDPKLDKKLSWEKISDKLKLSLGTTVKLHKTGLKILRKEIDEEKLETFHLS